MKALVIGATGFIGSHVARACLQAGHDVRIMKRQSSSMLALEDIEEKVETVVGDIGDPDSLVQAMKGCDWVFSTAAYYPLYSFDVEGQQKKALTQVQNIIDAVTKTKVARFIFTSSLSTIGMAKRGDLATEETVYDPTRFHGAYYRIKYAMEQALLDQCQRGFPAIVVNPTGIFGDYDVKPTSGQFLVMVATQKTPFLVNAPCNMVDVRDVAVGHVGAAEQGKLGERYILGGENMTIIEFAKQIAKLAKVMPPYGCVPIPLVKGVAWLSEYVSRYLLHRDRPLLPLVGIEYAEHGQHFDSSKAIQQLGLPQTPLDETIERALAWFGTNGYLS